MPFTFTKYFNESSQKGIPPPDSNSTFSKILALFKKQNYNSYSLSDILSEISAIRQTSDFIALYAQPTGINWKGIATATKNLFPKCSFSIPQYYSEPLLNGKELRIVADTIVKLKFREVCFSGCPLYFFKMISVLRPAVECSVVFHGTLTEIDVKNNIAELISLINQHVTEGKIRKVGFVRSGLSVIFKKLYGIESYELVIPPPSALDLRTVRKIQLDENRNHIGVLSFSNFNKNIFNQVAGALMVQNSIVHVLNGQNLDSLNAKSRIVNYTQHFNHEDFLCFLASMKLNMYISFSESWGQVVTESMALGVPCLAGIGSSVLAQNENLKKCFGVAETDNPIAIARQAEKVIENYEECTKLCKEATEGIRKKYSESLNAFINA